MNFYNDFEVVWSIQILNLLTILFSVKWKKNAHTFYRIPDFLDSRFDCLLFIRVHYGNSNRSFVTSFM